jgi:large subunit ribosomal protein L22
MANKTTVKTQPEVKAYARYIHISPRKLRLVADLVRKARADVALEQLRYSSKTAALPIMKLLNSAIANAVHNHQMKKEDLVVKAITIDGGPVYKRMEPRAQGRGFIVRKRTSHINIVLEARQRQKSKKAHRAIFTAKAKPAVAETADKPTQETQEGKASDSRGKQVRAPKMQDKVKQNKVDGKRRLFNRKSGE